jgi:hypothetical protein
LQILALPTISPAFEISPDLYAPEGALSQDNAKSGYAARGMVLRAIDAFERFLKEAIQWQQVP